MRPFPKSLFILAALIVSGLAASWFLESSLPSTDAGGYHAPVLTLLWVLLVGVGFAVGRRSVLSHPASDSPQTTVAPASGGHPPSRLPWPPAAGSREAWGARALSPGTKPNPFRDRRSAFRHQNTSPSLPPLHEALENMPDGILITDQAGRIVLANAALRALVDAPEPPDDLVGRASIEICREPQVVSAIRQGIDHGRTALLDIEIVRPSTHPRSAEVRVVPWQDEHRRRGGVLVFFRDTTRVRRLEAVRRDFVAHASHELRTPLATIGGYAEALLDGKGTPDDQRRGLEAIERNVKRLSALVDDILSLARLESNRDRPPLIPIEVGGCISDVLQRLQKQADDAGVRLRSPEVPPNERVLADRLALEQVLTNLIENGIKYTPEGGCVELRVSRRDDRISIEVEDTGIGIPKPELPRVFERFYRVNVPGHPRVKGTGLGLAIARHLVRSMGGEIEARSTLGQGSVFVFWLQAPPERTSPSTKEKPTEEGMRC